MALRQRFVSLRRRVLGSEVEKLRSEQHEELRRLRIALGSVMASTIAGAARSCEEAQFAAFSQFGEDGIIEFLAQRADLTPQTFVEIGVETYAEANTRFLAEHRLWRGVVVDLNPRLAKDLAGTQLNWRSQVNAVSAFVTRENVRQLLEPHLWPEGVGLLSIDIDGVDYWVLEELVGLQPALVIVEYNALFGVDAPVSVPYEPAFDRRRPEYHNIYYGAGLAAFDQLLSRLGYSLVGCTTAGNNAFFVHAERLGDVSALRIAEAFRPRRFVEHRDRDGMLTGIADRNRQLHDIRSLPLVDVTDGSALRVADLLDD